MRIGIFDSGLGGLTVLSSLIKKHPNNEYIYFGDTLNAPYGNRTKEELLLLSSKIVEFFIDNKVDKVIIACGTVSSNVYDKLKVKYNLPIIDILTPTIRYLKDNQFPKTIIMATSMTIQSGIFKPFNQIACPKLVPLIEDGKIDGFEIKEVLNEYLGNLDVEIVVLGCTHYPLVKKNIEECLNKKITFIDMGEVLANNIILGNDKYKLTFYFSAINDNIIKNVEQKFARYNIEELRL